MKYYANNLIVYLYETTEKMERRIKMSLGMFSPVLKEQILRIDFPLISQQSQEKLFSIIDSLYGHIFIGRNQDIENANSETPTLPRPEEEHIFIMNNAIEADKASCSVKIGRSFFLIAQKRTEPEVAKIDISKMFADIVNHIHKENEYFTLLRFGYRRIYQYFIISEHVTEFLGMKIKIPEAFNLNGFTRQKFEYQQLYQSREYNIRTNINGTYGTATINGKNTKAILYNIDNDINSNANNCLQGIINNPSDSISYCEKLFDNVISNYIKEDVIKSIDMNSIEDNVNKTGIFPV